MEMFLSELFHYIRIFPPSHDIWIRYVRTAPDVDRIHLVSPYLSRPNVVSELVEAVWSGERPRIFAH